MGAPVLSRLGGGTGGSGSVTVTNFPAVQVVSAVDLDIRNLSHSQDSVRIGDGTDLADVFDLPNSNPLVVAVVDGNGNQITSFSDTGSSITLAARSSATSPNLAAGASVDLDSSLIPNLKTGKLLKVTLSSSVACKWLLKKVDDAVETTFDTIYTSGLQGRPTERWETPDPSFILQVGTGTSQLFRVTSTNLDHANAADVHATFYWDEVTT